MSDNFSLIIKNGSCYIDGKLTKTDIGLLGNKIKKIGKIELNSSKVYDATNKIVLPGIIDTQVHFREPGSTDAEDLESGSRAAVLGGVTALFEMPNTNPPTSNLVEFDKKLQAAKNRMHSNYAFYFGATPDNTNQLAKLKDVEGCCGVKLFAGSSTGNLLVDKEADIEKVISSSDRVVSIHSEDEDIIKIRKKFIKKGDVHSHAEWRNVEVAMSSTRRVVKIAERYNKKIHVLHVTTREEVDFLAMHKKNVTFETTPQHLTIYASMINKFMPEAHPKARPNNLRTKIDEAIRLGIKNIVVPKLEDELNINFQNLINIKEISNIKEAVEYSLSE